MTVKVDSDTVTTEIVELKQGDSIMINYLIDWLVRFPIEKYHDRDFVVLNDLQKRYIQCFLDKLKMGVYKLESNPCLCGVSGNFFDVSIAHKEQHGLPCENVLCRNCGLIRVKERLDKYSIAEFYNNEYRAIYYGTERGEQEPLVDYFHDQVIRGEIFYERIKNSIDISSIKSVFEIGCGAGGILYPFFKNKMKVSGCDFGEQYLKFGQDKGLNLYLGEVDLQKTPVNSQDLVILSHVMEHFIEPLSEMAKIIELISPNKYLLVEVPGIFTVFPTYLNPVLCFQNAHVYYYYGCYLRAFFVALGLEILFGDEECVFY